MAELLSVFFQGCSNVARRVAQPPPRADASVIPTRTEKFPSTAGLTPAPRTASPLSRRSTTGWKRGRKRGRCRSTLCSCVFFIFYFFVCVCFPARARDASPACPFDTQAETGPRRVAGPRVGGHSSGYASLERLAERRQHRFLWTLAGRVSCLPASILRPRQILLRTIQVLFAEVISCL